ncbi:hypothetical protein QCA50_014946 [Cerrena zonata]|uniref:Uncharacterized protein n=1 Tax=Cerrena zonata TaxID=2478898 RepID=A0AAW0FJV2_9APHY
MVLGPGSLQWFSIFPIVELLTPQVHRRRRTCQRPALRDYEHQTTSLSSLHIGNPAKRVYSNDFGAGSM